MTIPLLGFGFAPFGSSVYGFGIPAQSEPTNKGILLQTADNQQGECRKLNDTTRDYSFDGNGRLVGTSAADQNTILALLTFYNSSAIPNFGLRINTQVIPDNYKAIISTNVLAALDQLISTNLISVDDVSVVKNASTQLVISVTYTDLSKQQQFTVTL